MRLDLCNAYMNINRESVIERAVLYERYIFDTYTCQNKENYPITVSLIHKSIDSMIPVLEITNSTDVNEQRIDMIIYKFQKLAIVNDLNADLPETMSIDKTRIKIYNSFITYSIFVATLLNLLRHVLTKIKVHDKNIDFKVVALAFNLDHKEMHDQSKMRMVASDIMEFLCQRSLEYLDQGIDEKFQNFFIAEIEHLFDCRNPVWILFKTRIEDAIFGDEKAGFKQIEPHSSIENLSDALFYIRDMAKRYQMFNRSAHLPLYKSIILDYTTQKVSLV
ncbi:hypothetical protein RF11_09423 [Thelohanellus kitauei]|uniref:Uncharacterized protein n=1 Tax=Thelohanellus kitauei TaxID=669202 RepID=A0A0C2N0E2_THEKT|nr:hypothetical protein RF11_09423 [Thelohanellus kitauei]